MIEYDEIRNHIATGVDAKILQYEENALEISDDKIDLIEILGGKQNCILINMEKVHSFPTRRSSDHRKSVV